MCKCLKNTTADDFTICTSLYIDITLTTFNITRDTFVL